MIKSAVVMALTFAVTVAQFTGTDYYEEIIDSEVCYDVNLYNALNTTDWTICERTKHEYKKEIRSSVGDDAGTVMETKAFICNTNKIDTEVLSQK